MPVLRCLLNAQQDSSDGIHLSVGANLFEFRLIFTRRYDGCTNGSHRTPFITPKLPQSFLSCPTRTNPVLLVDSIALRTGTLRKLTHHKSRLQSRTHCYRVTICLCPISRWLFSWLYAPILSFQRCNSTYPMTLASSTKCSALPSLL